MRLIARLILICTIILLFVILSLRNLTLKSPVKSNHLLQDFEYARKLLQKIDLEIKENSADSFQNFTQQTMRLLETSPKLCDVKLKYSIPKCEKANQDIKLKSMTYFEALNFGENTGLKYGGYWIQNKCIFDQTIAIIIPFRSRWFQVMQLLPILHQIMQSQNNCYRVFIVEQLGSEAFNKGRVNNAAFMASLSMFYFNCVIFHDTDLIPESSQIPYKCHDSKPVHLASAVDVNNYRLPYSTLIGGVIAFKTSQFISVNGYSNYYWGWGLEDDDMELRLKTSIGYNRIPENDGRYRTVKHEIAPKFKIQESRRNVLLSTATKRMHTDGLNSLKFQIIQNTNRLLYTHIIVDIGNQPLEFF